MVDTYRIDESEWMDRPSHLPVYSDFDPYGGDLDAEHAWKNFGSLTLPTAYGRFCERPEVYQEDFMFMGGRAFSFYYPVIERFLFQSRTEDEFDDCQAWILAHCIEAQFKSKTAATVSALLPRVNRLIQYVLGSLEKFSTTEEGRLRIGKAWLELDAVLNSKKEANQTSEPTAPSGRGSP